MALPVPFAAGFCRLLAANVADERLGRGLEFASFRYALVRLVLRAVGAICVGTIVGSSCEGMVVNDCINISILQ